MVRGAGGMFSSPAFNKALNAKYAPGQVARQFISDAYEVRPLDKPVKVHQVDYSPLWGDEGGDY
jgi:hypothetical protein